MVDPVVVDTNVVDPVVDPAPTSYLDGIQDVDLKNNPTLLKYENQEAQMRGHLELQAQFGKDKLIIPKDENDTVAHAAMNKYLGVPEDGKGYELNEVEMHDSAGVFNKGQFQDFMHGAGVRKGAAEKLWEAYTGEMKSVLTSQTNDLNARMDSMTAELKKDWGEAYETKIQRGQSVIDTFAESDDDRDWLTAQLGADPRGQRLLAKVGDQFAEASIGGFQEKQNFTYTPDEAKAELAIIKASPEYKSDNDRIRLPVVDRANELMGMLQK